MRVSASITIRLRTSLRLLVLALLGWSASMACGSSHDAAPSPAAALQGTIITLSGRSPLAGEGELRAISQSDVNGRQLATEVALASLQTVAPRGRLLPFSRSGNDRDVIDVVDVDTAASRQVASGRAPVASTDRVAYCAQGGQVVVAPLDASTEGEVVATVPLGCVRAAWNKATLAFLTLGTTTTSGGVTVHLWDGREPTEFEVPVPVHGYGPLTWSAQASSLLYSNGEKLIAVDLATKHGVVVGDGKAPKYSPVVDDLYAVVTAESAIEVRRRNAGTVATHTFAGTTLPWTIEFAWSPDGRSIAVVTPSCLFIWQLDSDATPCIAPTRGSAGYLPLVLWFS